MLRETHRIIAEKIADQLNFTSQNRCIYIDGILGPDTHGDFPHNKGRNQKILQLIDEARELYFLNDEYAYGKIANALHYIQDKWVDDTKTQTQAKFIDNDIQLEEIIKTQMPQETKKQYQNLINTLSTIIKNGIDTWFNHSWAIWHQDYASCVYVYTDIVEMMLPTIQPNTNITNNKIKLKEYTKTVEFQRAIKQGLDASIITNYLHPKIEGYQAAIFYLSMQTPPTQQANREINLQITCELSLIITKYTIAPASLFNYQDNWTHKTQNPRIKMGLLKPQYLTLITKPKNQLHQDRITNFYQDKQEFLNAWPKIQEAFSLINRSETWKILLTAIVENL